MWQPQVAEQTFSTRKPEDDRLGVGRNRPLETSRHPAAGGPGSRAADRAVVQFAVEGVAQVDGLALALDSADAASGLDAVGGFRMVARRTKWGI